MSSSSGAFIQPTFVPVAPVNPIASTLQSAAPSIINVGSVNNTLYIQNLNEKASISMLKYDLDRVFSRYGRIESIVAKKNIRMRGQAFVIFNDPLCARKALESQQGRPLYGKPLVIRYAKYKSDVISRRDGTYATEHAKMEQDRERSLHAAVGQPKKHPFHALLTAGTPAVAGASSAFELNRTLFVQSIPTGMTDEKLHEIFAKFRGFVEIRKVPGRPDLAFVDYESESQAFVAKEAIKDAEQMSISFAKK